MTEAGSDRVVRGRVNGAPPPSRAFGITTAVLLALLSATCILRMGAPMLAHRLPFVANNYVIGHADAPAYALQGRALAERHNLRIPYITTFFHPEPRDIWRLDDHWPPLTGVVLAPTFARYGPDAARARGVMVTVGALLLPLCMGWLCAVATRHIAAGLLGAAVVLASPTLAGASQAVLSDLLLSAMVCAYAASLLGSLRHRAWLLSAGFFGALAYYAKGSQILLLPMLPLCVVVLHGWRSLLHRTTLGAILIFLALLYPRLAANARSYGQPLHSSQSYVASFYGLTNGMWDNWDSGFYSVYWGRNLPSLRDRFLDPAAAERSLRRNVECCACALLFGPEGDGHAWAATGRFGASVRCAILGKDAPPPRKRRDVAPPPDARLALPDDWPLRGYVLLLPPGLLLGLAAALALPFISGSRYLRAIGVRLAVRRRQRRGDCAGPTEVTHDVPDNGASLPVNTRAGDAATGGRALAVDMRVAAVLFLLILSEVLFVILFWCATNRFTFPAFMLTVALGLLAASAVLHAGRALLALGLRRLPARARRAAEALHAAGAHLCPLVAATVCVALTMVWGEHAEALGGWQATYGQWPQYAEPNYPPYATLAQTIAEQLGSDVVLMTRNPWELLFYCPPGIRAVGLPYATPDVIFAVARYYGVTHFVWDNKRPGLREFMERGHPALTLVISSPYRVYAIDCSKFAKGELADLDRYIPPVAVAAERARAPAR